MAKVTRFEDLKCWQLARALVQLVFQACEESKLSKDFETRGQIKRAALSSMNNIAEGFGRYSNKDFIRFLDFSQSSSIEVKSITYAPGRHEIFTRYKNYFDSGKGRRNQELNTSVHTISKKTRR